MNNALDNIVQSLSKEEVRFFKLFLKRTDNKNRKDVNLRYIENKPSFIHPNIHFFYFPLSYIKKMPHFGCYRGKTNNIRHVFCYLFVFF